MAVYLVINGGRLTGVRVLAPCFDARGCFEGTLEDFREAVEETHKHEDSQFYREYLPIIEVIKARFPTGREHDSDS